MQLGTGQLQFVILNAATKRSIDFSVLNAASCFVNGGFSQVSKPRRKLRHIDDVAALVLYPKLRQSTQLDRTHSLHLGFAIQIALEHAFSRSFVPVPALLRPRPATPGCLR